MAASSDPATHFGPIAHPDLAQFNTHAIGLNQHFDQLSKVDTPIGCEIEGEL
jgi:hypothetical protein